MKKIILSLCLLLSTQVFASGKLTMQPTYYPGVSDKPYAEIGLGVFEAIWKNRIYFNHWSGVGEVPINEDDTKKWFATKTDIDFVLRKDWGMILSPGFKITNMFEENNEMVDSYHLKLSVKLW